jgi:hypothetical protein
MTTLRIGDYQRYPFRMCHSSSPLRGLLAQTDTLSDKTQAPQRLEQVLDYLRSTYHYCFWCGTQYASVEESDAECPGLTEEDHD